jgi:hypothetical protein
MKQYQKLKESDETKNLKFEVIRDNTVLIYGDNMLHGGGAFHTSVESFDRMCKEWCAARGIKEKY